MNSEIGIVSLFSPYFLALKISGLFDIIKIFIDGVWMRSAGD